MTKEKILGLAQDCKILILKKISTVRDKFPMMEFATDSGKVLIPGIELRKNGNKVVVLIRDGIFRFSLENGRPRWETIVLNDHSVVKNKLRALEVMENLARQ